VLLVTVVGPGVVSGWQPAAPMLASRSAGRLASQTHTGGRAGLRPAGAAVRMVAAKPATTYDRAAWMRGWESARKELDPYTVPTHCVQGELPRDLVKIVSHSLPLRLNTWQQANVDKKLSTLARSSVISVSFLLDQLRSMKTALRQSCVCSYVGKPCPS
jgi:hypothetical protein